jgi:hypothetical protein
MAAFKEFVNLSEDSLKKKKETAAMEDRILREFKESDACTESVLARLKACSMKYSGLWLVTPVSDRELCLNGAQLSIALRLRLGLPPLPHAVMPEFCVCGKEVVDDLWQSLSCPKIKRRSITQRHDKVVELVLARFTRSHAHITVERKDGPLQWHEA